MSTPTVANPEQKPSPPVDWYVRVGDKTVYGPVLLGVLKEWAAQGRIGRGNEVSADRATWVSAEQLPDLQMQWFAHLKSGDEYGPFHILAAPHMVRRGIIGPDAILENRTTGTKVPVRTLIKPGEIVEEEPRQDTASHRVPPLSREETDDSVDRGSWYLRVRDGMVYGPVRMEKLKEWTLAGRIGPGNQVSKDRKTWAPADSIPDLKMDWIARSSDGKEYGPFSLLALHNLVRDGVIAPDSILRDRYTGKQVAVQSLGDAAGWVRETGPDRQTAPSPSAAKAPVSETAAVNPQQLRNRVAEMERQVASMAASLEEAHRSEEQKQRDCTALRHAAEAQKADLLSQIEVLTELQRVAGTLRAERDDAQQAAVNERNLREAAEKARSEGEAALRARLKELESLAESRGQQDSALAAKVQELQGASGSLRAELETAQQAAVNERNLREAAEKARSEGEAALRARLKELESLAQSKGQQESEWAVKVSELQRASGSLRAELETAQQAVADERRLREAAEAARSEGEVALRARLKELESLAQSKGQQESELALKVSELQRESGSLRAELETAQQAVADERRLREAAEAARSEGEAALRARIGELESLAESSRGTHASDDWYLKLEDGSTFGPVRLSELCAWAAQCRIGPDHQVSADKERWMSAKEVSALQMDWIVHLVDGSTYGPLNLAAMRYLVEQGVTTPTAAVTDTRTGLNSRLADVLLSDERKAGRSVGRQGG